jgi:hypothetical protein
MEINDFTSYLDGGTVEVETNKGVYCFDYRLMTETAGRLYDGYPEDDNSNIIKNSEELENEIIEALKGFRHSFYQDSIDAFIKSRQK